MDPENAIRTPGCKGFIFNHLKPLRSENATLSAVKKVPHPVEVSWVGCGAEVARNDNN
jgi:hypothetical protein